MFTWYTVARIALCSAVGILLGAHGIFSDDAVFWIVMVGMAAAGLLGYDEGRGDAS